MKKYHRTKSEFEEDWPILHIDDARRHGYIPYSTPCAILKEGHMVQNMLSDIRRNGRDKPCVVKLPGSMVEVWIIANHNSDHPHPYIRIPPDET